MKALGISALLGLPDHCADVLAFGVALRHAADPGPADELRTKFKDLLGAFEKRARKAGVPEESVGYAKYALIAHLDEIVLESSWAIKTAWGDRPLQLEFFDSFTAGEEFFRKLEEIRKRSRPDRKELLEVYYLCLALDFRGKYQGKTGDDSYRLLLGELCSEILDQKALSPH